MQSIIIGDVFGKRVAIYEQIMKGLKELEFLNLVQNNKEIFMKFFFLMKTKKILLMILNWLEMDLQRSFSTSLLRKRLKRLF